MQIARGMTTRPGMGPRLLLASPLRRQTLIFAAKKGFGADKKAQDVDKKRKPGGQVRRGAPPAPVGPQRVPGALTDLQLRRVDELNETARRQEDDADFMQRLELVKLEGREKKAAVASPASPGTPGSAAPAAPRAAFDPLPGGPEDIYASPPSLAETLMDKMNSDISDPALRKAAIGPDKIGLAVGALTLGLVIVLVSGADFSAPTNRYKGVRASKPLPDERTAQLLEARAASFKATLDRSPDDLEALEGLAVTKARLGEYGDAADLLDKLVAKRPGDSEALRVLGEASLLSAQPARAVAAYEKAVALEPRDQQIITGLTDSYIANAQQSKAITMLTRLRDDLASDPPASAARTAAAAAGPSAAAADGAGQQQQGDGEAAAAAAAAGRVSRPVDPVAVRLLLGKTYAGWRGHDSDALAAYDDLIRLAPEDFRGYLAKGVFLKERGRRGDAERMFLQAKFYAPDSAKAFVAARAGENAEVDLPDNNS